MRAGRARKLKRMTHQRTWFVTGTSSGIGRSLVEQLLARGQRVVATVRTATALDALAATYGDRLHVAILDVAHGDAVHRTVDEAFAVMGTIDVVVNNAGYALFGAAEEATDAQIRRQLDTNLVGSIDVIRAALPHLRASGGGRIVQISSEGGQLAYPNFSYYHASKWGIEGFIEAVALETAPFGITYTIIEPGPTSTSFGDGLERPESMAAYDATPAGEMRRALATRAFELPGDAAKIARVIIESADREHAPKRLVLGGGAFERVRTTLRERLAELDGQRAVAYSTDRDGS